MTATLSYAGLKSSIVGCTNFCVDPTDLHKSASLVGGTKDPDIDLIVSLKPNLIFVNREENRIEDFEKLAQICEVFESFPKSPYDVSDDFKRLSERFPSVKKFAEWNDELLRLIPKISKNNFGPSLYFIWKNPYMIAGQGSYIHALLELFGFSLPELNQSQTYPTLDLREIAAIDLKYILLATEPYPFRKRDLGEFNDALKDTNPVFLKADGKLFSWHGYHTLEALSEFEKYMDGKEQRLFKPFS